MIAWDDSGWLSHGSTLQVIKPSDSNKFYKFMKLSMTPQAKGLHFGPKHLEQTISSCFHFIKTGQGKTRQHYLVLVPLRAPSGLYHWYLFSQVCLCYQVYWGCLAWGPTTPLFTVLSRMPSPTLCAAVVVLGFWCFVGHFPSLNLRLFSSVQNHALVLYLGAALQPMSLYPCPGGCVQTALL